MFLRSEGRAIGRTSPHGLHASKPGRGVHTWKAPSSITTSIRYASPYAERSEVNRARRSAVGGLAAQSSDSPSSASANFTGLSGGTRRGRARVDDVIDFAGSLDERLPRRVPGGLALAADRSVLGELALLYEQIAPPGCECQPEEPPGTTVICTMTTSVPS